MFVSEMNRSEHQSHSWIFHPTLVVDVVSFPGWESERNRPQDFSISTSRYLSLSPFPFPALWTDALGRVPFPFYISFTVIVSVLISVFDIKPAAASLNVYLNKPLMKLDNGVKSNKAGPEGRER